MTRVEFFFNIEDKLLKVAELCEKALLKGRKLTVFCSDTAMTEVLHQQLWQHSPTSFLANKKATDLGTAKPKTAAFEAPSEITPIVLIHDDTHLVHDDVLINLQAETPQFFSRFRYMAEIVGHDEVDKVVARNKFRFYRDRGYEVKSTDVRQAP